MDYNPFSDDQQRHPHRIRVTDKYGFLFYERKIPAGADLRTEWEDELRWWASQGWTVEKPFKVMCFVHNDEQRCCIGMAAAHGDGPSLPHTTRRPTP